MTETWTRGPDLPKPLFFLGNAVVMSDRVYALNAYSVRMDISPDGTMTWTKMEAARLDHKRFAVVYEEGVTGGKPEEYSTGLKKEPRWFDIFP